MRSARSLAEAWFTGPRARGVFAGLAAHSIMPLDILPTAAFGLILGMLGHAVGWPLPQGGSQHLATALAAYLCVLGGELVTGTPVTSVDELPPARTILLDVTPRQVLRLAGHCLSARYQRRLERYRYGAAVFKMDWALNGPIPWKAQACRRAATVHLGGTLSEIAASEHAACTGQHAEAPYMILAQQSLYDVTRAPTGQHTVWAYCHVPHGSTVDMTARLEAQIERFAPGFQDCILARNVMSPTALEQYNANYIGGDINGGVQDLWQLFTRPTMSLVPYNTPVKGLYICSSSTPPGGGVHGMCGYWAARAALRRELGQRSSGAP
jgi:phytoene dehydrogenase-like protein